MNERSKEKKIDISIEKEEKRCDDDDSIDDSNNDEDSNSISSGSNNDKTDLNGTKGTTTMTYTTIDSNKIGCHFDGADSRLSSPQQHFDTRINRHR